MIKINYTEVAIDDIVFPKEMNYFIISNNSLYNTSLLEKIINSSYKEIHITGKYSLTWQLKLDGLYCDIDDGKDCSRVSSIDMECFIYWLNNTNNDEIVILFDDEKMKDYIIRRIGKETKRRYELNVHTRYTHNLGLNNIGEYISPYRIDNVQGIGITDKNSIEAYDEAIETLNKYDRDFDVIYGAEIDVLEESVIALCRNNNGKKALFEYLSNNINLNRNDLLIGSCVYGSVFKYALNGDIELLDKRIEYFDYIEVAPINTYKLFDKKLDDEKIKETIRLIIDECLKLNKIVIASSTPYYRSEDDYLEFSVLYNHNHKDDHMDENVDLHLYSTEYLRYAFDFLEDEKLIDDIVVNNTYKVANMCLGFKPFENYYNMPIVFDAYQMVEKIAYEKVKEIYGNDLDSIIKRRLNKELEIIKDSGYAGIFYIISNVCKESKNKGYAYAYRGLAASSFVLYLLGITDVNPLIPHYYCPNCHKIIWNIEYEDGLDIDDKLCDCGSQMISDGHDLNYQFLMGFNGEKIPDIDINFSSEFISLIPDIIKNIAPMNDVYYASIDKILGYSEAKKIAEDFIEEPFIQKQITNKLKDIVIDKYYSDERLIIVPKNINIYDLSNIKNDKYLGRNYLSISDHFYKFDCFRNNIQDIFSKVDIDSINIKDKKIYEYLNNNDLSDIKQLNNEFINKIIKQIKPNCFSDVLKIISFSYDTNAWDLNGELLIQDELPFKELPSNRDEIYEYLLGYALDEKDAYSITEDIRKGKVHKYGFTEKQKLILKEHLLPEWFYICANKIEYLVSKSYALRNTIDALKLIWLKIYESNINL